MGMIIYTNESSNNDSSSNSCSSSPNSCSSSPNSCSSNSSSPNYKKTHGSNSSLDSLNNSPIPSSSSFGSSCSFRDTNTSITQLAISNIEITRKDIEQIIDMKPINIIKYKQAFVHKSIVKCAKENDCIPEYMKNSYERYEFLGDSVLSLVVAKYLFNKYPNEHEGYLTKLRTKLVNGKTLSFLAEKLNLGKFLILNTKVENINGRTNKRILEDVFEALICAVYLDLGFDYAEKFIISTINKFINFDELLIDNNYKDILLRYCQNKYSTTPTYELIESFGPPHNKTFKIICLINGKKHKYGMGKNKKDAEQISAQETLNELNIKNF